MKIYRPHPFAEMLPATDDDEYFRIREDISKNGLTVPIVLYHGMILDGRTRYRACIDLGIKPLFVHFYGEERDALVHVASHNLYRRHLDPSQRTVVGLKYEALLIETGMSKTRARTVAAEVAGTSETSIRQAEMIECEEPAALTDILNGKETVNAAAKKIRVERDPLTIINQRLNEAESALGRLRQAVSCDLDYIGTTADLRQLLEACRGAAEHVSTARKLIARIKQALARGKQC